MLKRNVIANYVGAAWSALIGIAFVPLYVKYLGDEAYGVVGVAAAVHAFLSFFDAGLTPMLAREMSRFMGGAHSAESIRSLLRTVELWAWCVSTLAVVGLWLAAPWIAEDWLRTKTLSPHSVTHALQIMALVIGLRFLEGLYRGCLVGLQRQVTTSTVSVVSSTFRALGSVGILAWWSPTLNAFFWWQGAMSMLSLAAFALCTYTALPRAHVSLTIGADALLKGWPFARGMLLSSCLVLGLSQTDKILLSRMLTLDDFGKYTVALAAANCVTMAAGPIFQAFYPKMALLHASEEHSLFRHNFHVASQLMTVAAATIGGTLIVFGDQIISIWTCNDDLAQTLSGPLRLLAIGNVLNAFMTVPYLCQLAIGWTSVSNRLNACAIVFVVPALLWIVPIYGMIGAAATWIALNVAYLAIGAPLSFRRLLNGEMSTWYVQDLLLPSAAALGVLAVCKTVGTVIVDHHDGMRIVMICISSMLAATAAATSAPDLRNALATAVKAKWP